VAGIAAAGADVTDASVVAAVVGAVEVAVVDVEVGRFILLNLGLGIPRLLIKFVNK
jgi:hypothetical protein